MTVVSREAPARAPRPSGPIPFVDLRPQHDEVRAELRAMFEDVLDRSAFVGGEYVERFEADFASYLSVEHVLAVANGTDAVKLALQAVGTRAGDLVLTVAHTFIGSVEGLVQLGADPVFLDVEQGALTLDPAALGRFLEEQCARSEAGVLHRPSGRRVAAVLPVHLYGQSADMEPLLRQAREWGVPVVEDAAQAHGATYRFSDGREYRCGAMGDAGAFSFYPGKNLGALGEGGAVVVRDERAARDVRLLRDHGQDSKYVHAIAHGGNVRLAALQAAALTIKLARLDDWNEGRRRAASAYDTALASADVVLPTERTGARHVYHLYVVHHEERDRLRDELAAAGVATGLHYPTPLHEQPAFRGRAIVGGPLPVTEWAARTCLSLPMYPHLGPELAAEAAARLSAVVS